MGLIKFMLLIGITFQLFIPSTIFAIDSCNKEKIAQFKELYFKLQQDLNYHKKNTVILKKNGNGPALKKHSVDEKYEGKTFEEALFREYQNSLIKVAKIYQIEKNATYKELTNQNSDLIDFFKSIDDKNLSSPGFEKFDDIFESIKKLSLKRNDPKLTLNDYDIYLLKNLLIHAQNKICITSPKNKDIEKHKNTPLQYMIKALHKGKNNEIIDTKMAITESITGHLNDLRKWVKNNNNCFKYLSKKHKIIQDKIQPCYYEKFMKSLLEDNSSLSDLKTILNFIDANKIIRDEKGNIISEPIAETDLSLKNLEDYINKTFVETPSGSSGSVVLKKIEAERIEAQIKPTKQIVTGAIAVIPKDTEPTEPIPQDEIIKEKIKESEAQIVKDQFSVIPLQTTAKIEPTKQIVIGAIAVIPKDTEPTEPIPLAEIIKEETKESCSNKVDHLWQEDHSPFIINHVETSLSCFKKHLEYDEQNKKCIDDESRLIFIRTLKGKCIKVETPKEKEKDKEDKEDKEENEKTKCEKKIEKDKDEYDTPLNNFSWDSENKKCVDKRNKKDKSSSGEEDEDTDIKEATSYPNHRVPGRFQPIQIPTRPVFMLPGMP